MGKVNTNIIRKWLKERTDPRVIKARGLREGIEPRQNPDGTVSTVKMVSTGVDGKHYAHPSIFPTKGGDWIEPKGKWGAYDEAEKRRELFEFGTEAESRKFAEGSWKKKETPGAGRPIDYAFERNVKPYLKKKLEEKIKLRQKNDK